MSIGKERHMFPGGNTHLGFFSYYGYIISQEEDYMNCEILDTFRDELDQNRDKFDSLMDVALSCVAGAKAAHDQLERYYVPNIDFEAIDCFFNTILLRMVGKIPA